MIEGLYRSKKRDLISWGHLTGLQNLREMYRQGEKDPRGQSFLPGGDLYLWCYIGSGHWCVLASGPQSVFLSTAHVLSPFPIYWSVCLRFDVEVHVRVSL